MDIEIPGILLQLDQEFVTQQDVVFQDHSLKSEPATALPLRSFWGQDFTTQTENEGSASRALKGIWPETESPEELSQCAVYWPVNQPSRWQREPGSYDSRLSRLTFFLPKTKCEILALSRDS